LDANYLVLFGIPAHLMPSISPSLGLFGYTQPELLGVSIPIPQFWDINRHPCLLTAAIAQAIEVYLWHWLL